MPAHRCVLFKPEMANFHLKGKRDVDVINDGKITWLSLKGLYHLLWNILGGRCYQSKASLIKES